MNDSSTNNVHAVVKQVSNLMASEQETFWSGSLNFASPSAVQQDNLQRLSRRTTAVE